MINNEQLNKRGALVLRIDTALPKNLYELYKELYPATPSFFYGNHRHETPEFNHLISQRILELAQSVISHLGLPFEAIFGSFAIKPEFYHQEFNLHQDWSIVNEQQNQSLQMWIPLVDTDESNGGMFILPYSHRFFTNLRSATYPIAQIPRKGILKYLAPVIPLKAGQALLFYHSTFHGSVSNLTNQDRPAVIISMKRTNSEMIYYHKSNSLEADVYAIDPDFYLNYVPLIEKGNIPKGYQRCQKINYQHFKITPAMLMQKYLANSILNLLI